MDDRQEVKSLKKALRVLTFMNRHGESTVTEVACAIGVPRTTSYRLLQTLATEGFVEKQAHSDVYRLTSLVQRLSSGFSDIDLIVEIAKPMVREVGEEIGWPLALATPRGQDMVVRISTDHDTSLAIDRYPIGFATPMLHAPSGFCYLAYCEPEVLQCVVDAARAAGMSEDELRDGGEFLAYRLDQIRRKGFCHLLFTEYSEGGLSVPLVVGGRAVGGLVMRYIKRSLKTTEIEQVYFPKLQRLAENIASAYEARMSRAKIEPTVASFPAPRAAISGSAPLQVVIAGRQLSA